MEVKINKEIRDYTESIFFGLTLRQCFFSGVGCINAVIAYFYFINKVGLEVTTWICMIAVAPFAGLAFVKFQGMNAEQIIKTAWRSFLLTQKQLEYRPINYYFDIMKSYMDQRKKEALIKDDKKLRKNKKSK